MPCLAALEGAGADERRAGALALLDDEAAVVRRWPPLARIPRNRPRTNSSRQIELSRFW